MSIDLIVDNPMSETPQVVKDQQENNSALSLSTVAAGVTGILNVAGEFNVAGQPAAAGAQVSVLGGNGAGQVAGFKLSTLSGWTVLLRTVQEGSWLELADGNGAAQHQWTGSNYNCLGNLSVGGGGVTFSGLANLPTTGTTDLTINANGQVAPQTSSMRFKENIEPLRADFGNILSADPVSFVNKATGDREIGFLAEDFHDKHLDGLVSYDAEGKPLSIQYKMVPIYLLEVIKEQQRAIEELKGEIAEIKSKAH